VQLRSRNDKDFTRRYSSISSALDGLPDETVVDGEVVALDSAGRPSFNALQHFGSASLRYYVFDIMIHRGRSVMDQPLSARRSLLEARVLSNLAEPVGCSCRLDAPLPALIQSVRAQGLEGLVAKRPDSLYEAGRRSGAWRKMRLNRRGEFVIGGYTVGSPFDALVIGRRDEAGSLHYVARVRNGFTPALRAQVARRFAGLGTAQCPFVNLPEAYAGRWGQGLTAEKMAACRWLNPILAAEFEFVEETPDGHLRHVTFAKVS
jgi:bifunctional non-homologous end joining protein LigD